MGTDPYNLSNANANTASDLRAALKSLATNYFSAMKSGVDVAFTNAGVAAPLYTGPDTLGTWTSTPPAEILQAASGIVDILSFGGAYGNVYTQDQVNYIASNYGGPITLSFFLEADYDSPYARTAQSGVDFATQALRGAAFISDVTAMLATTTTSGFNPWVGLTWESYGDYQGTNWGLVTLKDNAYDGHESVMGSVTCSAPMKAYTCGGESGNYGDLISPIIVANGLWLLSGK
jgi:hypothetical protein